MLKSFLSLIIVFLFLGVNAQEVKVDSSNSQYLEVDTANFVFEEDVHGEHHDIHFDSSYITVVNDTLPRKVVSRYDTIPLSSKVRALIEDSLFWMAIDTNFAMFDSMSVNPYEVNGAKYKDTNTFVLYDTIQSEGSRSWSMPLKASYVTSKFGFRRYKWHYGTDLRLSIGDTVLAVFDGVVRVSKRNPGGYGNYILLRHFNGTETVYGHLKKQLVHVGDSVKAGDLIGWGGNTGRSTGPHLHFEVRYHGNAIDATKIFDFEKHTIKLSTITIDPSDYLYLKQLKAARYHRIRSGDTLSGLAVRYRTSVSKICRLNHISTRTVLRIGRVLRVR